MKIKLYPVIGSLALAVVTIACSDYLNESSGDLLIPEKVEEFQSVLYGEGYPDSYTDDVEWMDLNHYEFHGSQRVCVCVWGGVT